MVGIVTALLGLSVGKNLQYDRASQMTKSANSWHSANREERLNSSKASSNSNKASSNSKDSSSNRNRDFSSSRVSNNSHSRDFNSSHSRVSPDRVLLLPSSRLLPSRPRCRPDQRYFSM